MNGLNGMDVARRIKSLTTMRNNIFTSVYFYVFEGSKVNAYRYC